VLMMMQIPHGKIEVCRCTSSAPLPLLSTRRDISQTEGTTPAQSPHIPNQCKNSQNFLAGQHPYPLASYSNDSSMYMQPTPFHYHPGPPQSSFQSTGLGQHFGTLLNAHQVSSLIIHICLLIAITLCRRI
jgi:hypothetical protein